MKCTSASVVVGAWRSIGVALTFMAVGCLGDFPGGNSYSSGHYYPPGPVADGGVCTYHGGNAACGCVDQPYVLG
ncbi:MAG TPA: hypothetical protein VIM14_16570, partial [Polyangia bacterium]